MNWVPAMGRFEIANDRIRFKGELVKPVPPPEAMRASLPGWEELVAKGGPDFGILLGDQPMIDGRFSATVTFGDAGIGSACELIIANDIERGVIILAGIAATPNVLFSIRELNQRPTDTSAPFPAPPWRAYYTGGDTRNLQKNRPYTISVSVRGNEVVLAIDGVRVGAGQIPSLQKYERQTGFMCSGIADVTIEHVTIEAAQPLAFVVMQFSPPYDEVYSSVIKDVCAEFDLETVRADEIYGPGLIIHDVTEQLSRSTVVIADITPPNPNVFFEVGYALAQGKPIILLAEKGTSLPFDVGGFRVLFYENTIGGKDKVSASLRGHLRAVLGPSV